MNPQKRTKRIQEIKKLIKSGMHKGEVVAKGKTFYGNQYIIVRLIKNGNYMTIVDNGDSIPVIDKKVKILDDVKIARAENSAILTQDE